MIKRRDFCLRFAASLLLPRGNLPAQKDIFLPDLYRSASGQTVPFRLFVPRVYDKSKKYPLVLWLHGGAGRGNDNLKQISGGNTIGSHIWTRSENEAKYPCFVLAPQCPDNDLWATLDTAKPTKQLQLVIELMQGLRNSYSIDAQRLYVSGQSLGGFGTWSLISAHPQMFAAAIPICGGGNESDAGKLVKVPIWAFHGENDAAVSVDRSRKIIAAIRRAGGSPKYTEYQRAAHAIWDRVFSERELLPWVFAQKSGPNG